MSKEVKDQLIKARCTRTMKHAVTLAAADMPGDNNDESDVVRVAVEEYLSRRGYVTARIGEDPGPYKTKRRKRIPPKKSQAPRVLILKETLPRGRTQPPPAR